MKFAQIEAISKYFDVYCDVKEAYTQSKLANWSTRVFLSY